MSRPFLLLLLIACLFTGFLGAAWLALPPSNQELLANYAKAQDYANAAAQVHGLPWWSPGYLMGSSLAFLSVGALTNILLYGGSLVAGPYLGTKLAALLFLLACPLTMYGFIRRLCPDSRWTAFACGASYLFAPAVLLRLGHVEHVGNVLAFALLPLSFWSVLAFLEEKNARTALLCALCNALLTLAYVKIAILIFPLLVPFALWAWITRGHFLLPSWPAILLCLGVYFVLAVLPNLPSVREMTFVAKFAFGPFAGWQKHYSQESILSWLDRDSFLSGTVTSAQSEVATSSAYTGLVGFLCVAALFFLRRRPGWLSPEGSVFRLFVALALIAQWLAFGVNNALTGQLAFLFHAEAAWDPAIALSWVLLVLQGVALYLILPGSLPSRRWWAAAAIVIYYLVPGFRLIEKLPFYGDIRAPHDFFEMGGIFCFSVAAGIAAFLVLREIPFRLPRLALATALLVVAALDATTVVPSFFRAQMDRQTFDDFLEAQKFLAADPNPGRVSFYSGRYFYLLTPLLSGRGLVTEAFTGHLLSRGVALLQAPSFESKSNLHDFLNVSGVSHVLIDRQDVDLAPGFENSLRAMLPVAFENEHFLVLKNPSALSPAAFAPNFTPVSVPEKEIGAFSLNAAHLGLAAISERSAFGDNEGQTDLAAKTIQPLSKIPPQDFQRAGPEKMTIKAPSQTGWLIIPETYHPDWRAFRDGQPLEVARAFSGFLGVRLKAGQGDVTLRFTPPAWYAFCVLASLAAWAVLLVTLAADRLRLLPAAWRESLAQAPAPPPLLSFAPAGMAPPPALKKFLLVIPTYNEAAGIAAILEKALAAHPALEILVVDDGSPDGTAAIVRRQPQFDRRVHLLERAGKLGLGSAYRAGFDWAMSRDIDACLEMDADFSHDPADIPRLIQALENGADAAIGSRYLDGVRVMNWPQDRLFLSLGASKFVRTLTGLPLTDATSGFKAIRCDALRRLDWTRFTAQGYGFQVELHYFLWKSGARLVEVPIVFTERREGNTKMSTGIALEALGRVLQLALRGK